MAIGPVTKFNQLEQVIMSTTGTDWDSVAAGSFMFILVGNLYTPDVTHTVTGDLTDIITAGDGAPINVPTPAIDILSVPGTTFLSSGSANFGTTVTITTKFLICINPLAAATFSATTSKLLWYVDLDDATGTAERSSTNSDFVINTPANGWLSYT